MISVCLTERKACGDLLQEKVCGCIGGKIVLKNLFHWSETCGKSFNLWSTSERTCDFSGIGCWAKNKKTLSYKWVKFVVKFLSSSLRIWRVFCDWNKTQFCYAEFQVSAYLLCFVSICPWSVLSSASLLSLDPEELWNLPEILLWWMTSYCAGFTVDRRLHSTWEGFSTLKQRFYWLCVHTNKVHTSS